MKLIRKAFTCSLVAGLAIGLAACGGDGGDDADAEALPPGDPGSVSGEITVLTQRTDLVQDGTFKRYAAEFNKTYPKVTVKFEGITDYANEVKIRMNTENYGDVLMIPDTISRDDYPKFFASLGDSAELSKKILFTDKATVDGKVYGLASFAAANGFVYNKDVWTRAGVTDWPTTPEEFLGDLQAIKSRTGSIPYYTNYKDGWPLTQWVSVVGSPSCDGGAQDKLADTADPWAGDGDLRVGDKLLFDIVQRKLSEPDPTTTNWEDSKGQLANGKIATMWLGSWALQQMQDAAKKAGKDPASIGFMPFPKQVDGKFCSVLAPDYQYAVNTHSTAKPAARAFIDFLLYESGYAKASEAVSAIKGEPLPNVLQGYDAAGVTLVPQEQANAGKVLTIDNQSEVGINKPDYRQKLVDIARGAAPGSFDKEVAALGKKWGEAQKLGG